MHISELKESKFLKKEDCNPPRLLTINGVSQVNVAKEGAPAEMRWAVHFDTEDKPLILNATNGQAIAAITGSEDSEGWTGKQVVLYSDPNVSFQGKLVGGIRIRAARNKPAQPAKPVSKPQRIADQEPIDDSQVDDVPF